MSALVAKETGQASQSAWKIIKSLGLFGLYKVRLLLADTITLGKLGRIVKLTRRRARYLVSDVIPSSPSSTLRVSEVVLVLAIAVVAQSWTGRYASA
jgi:hypothetical protein